MIRKEEVRKMVDKFVRYIFTEFFKENTEEEKNMREVYLGELKQSLEKQLLKIFEFCKVTDKDYKDISEKFFDKFDTVIEYAKTDLQAAYDGDPAAKSLEEIVLAYPGIFAITVNRISHELYLLDVPVLPRLMTEYAHSETGIDIHPGATIGKYFFIDHGTGVVVGETSIIGDNVKIYQGVTIGALSTRGGQKLSGEKRHPTIENNVTIYSNASVLGGDTVIGENSVVGGNAFITMSIPKNTRVSIKNPELNIINK